MAVNQATLTKDVFTQCTSVTSTSLSTILTSDTTYDRMITVFQVVSTDTSAQTLTLFINNGSSDFQLGIYSIPLNSGNVSGTAAVDLRSILSSLFIEKDISGVSYFNIKKEYSIKVQLGAVTSAKKFDFLISGGIYN